MAPRRPVRPRGATRRRAEGERRRTANVLAFCKTRTSLRRLQYVSTCYVSGRYNGEFSEDDLDVGQEFYNHYESTKFEAEALVRDAMADELPATIYRPGIVVGDSVTGETQKYDGPYFVAEFLRRQRLPIAVLPSVDETVRTSLVARDFVIEAMDEFHRQPGGRGDPRPPPRQARCLCGGAVGDRTDRAWQRSRPGVGTRHAELIDYFTTRTTYSTKNTVADLAGTGVECPRFADYAGRLLDYMIAHPDIGSAAMV